MDPKNKDVHCTIIHSCPQDVTHHMAEAIRNHFGHAAKDWWQPGHRLGIDTCNFTRSSPVKDRNGLEMWQGNPVRFVSYDMVMVELRTKGGF